MATYTLQRLGQVQLGTGSTTIHTAIASVNVQDITMANNNSAAVSVTIWIGSAATDAETLIASFSIPANDFIHWSGMQYMASAATLKGKATVASNLTVTATGVSIT